MKVLYCLLSMLVNLVQIEFRKTPCVMLFFMGSFSRNMANVSKLLNFLRRGGGSVILMTDPFTYTSFLCNELLTIKKLMCS